MENQVQTQAPKSKIIIAEDDQALDYWSKEFGISKEELTENVKAGRPSTEAVEKYVKRVKLTA
jgi:Protein of unknown function (DUF3606)